MSISRPFLLVLLGAVLLGATAVAVQNARDEGSSSSPATAGQASKPTGESTGGLDANGAVAAAFSGSGALDSGKVAARLSFRQVGGGGRSVRLGVDGAFQSSSRDQMPLFALRLKVNTGGKSLSAGAVSLGNRAFLTSGATGYRVPSALWQELQNARKQIASYAGKGTSGQAPGVLGLNPRNWLTNVKDEGQAQLDGVTTKHVSASVDAGRLVRDLVPLARQGGAAVSLPKGLDKAVSKAVKRGDVDIYVGQEDRILRRLRVALDLDFSAPSSGAVGGAGRAKVNLDFRLRDVNKPQHITAPAHVVAGAPRSGSALSSAVLGVGVLAVDPPPGLAQARRAGFKIGDVTSPAPVTNNPRKVARAVRAHQKVVIFFRNPRGLDDQATAEAVRSLRAHSKAKVFTDDVRSVDRYGKILEDVGVNQAPAIVIIDRRHKAHLIEGYVDAEALAQEVADAR